MSAILCWMWICCQITAGFTRWHCNTWSCSCIPMCSKWYSTTFLTFSPIMSAETKSQLPTMLILETILSKSTISSWETLSFAFYSRSSKRKKPSTSRKQWCFKGKFIWTISSRNLTRSKRCSLNNSKGVRGVKMRMAIHLSSWALSKLIGST